MARHRAALAAGLLLLSVAGAAAQGPSASPIVLAWDPSGEPGAGYRVHVGTNSGDYSQTFDADQRTTFNFTSGVPGRRYFFAITSYLADGTSSPLSSEVSVVAVAAARGRSSSSPLALGQAAADRDSPQVEPSREPGSDAPLALRANCPSTARDCFATELLSERLHLVTAISAAADGSLFVVEDGRHLHVLSRGRGEPIPALQAVPGTRIVDAIPHPTFATTGQVLVVMAGASQRASGASEASGAGEASGASGASTRAPRHLSVVRYRWAAERMGEAAVVIPALPIDAPPEPRVTVDAAGRMYLAMPGDDASSDPYAAKLLRFNDDGTVPGGNRAASPVFALSYASPTRVRADEHNVWVMASADGLAHWLARLPRDPAAADPWPLVPELVTLVQDSPDREQTSEPVAAPGGPPRARRLLPYVDGGTLSVIDLDDAVVESVELTDGVENVVVEAAAIGYDGAIYVAVRRVDGSSAVARLTRD